ncbi:PLD-like domain-containing protein [Halogranum amylolyticum]|uniref:PLD-like domain-containing protein n=1 Tax=Halogranum amylolyticum TaxID=660520 RepID=A0A1H8NZS5_9EURY|nr:phospholipase D-like domain-containing protein [Halogranum amylolyticum]SEO35011.1 PLD-like domain-containing protein [Halogranum amylolyticum]
MSPPSGGVASAASPPPDSSPPHDDRDAYVVSLYPNPFADGDRGEFVVVGLSAERSGNWTLTDGEATVALPTDATGSNGSPTRLVVTVTPTALPNGTTGRVVRAPAAFELANGGERLRLKRDGVVVDRVAYENAPEGERWRRDRTPRWRPLGFSPRSVAVAGSTTAETFVLPDAPDVPRRTLRSADRRILLAGYTFASPHVANLLVAAAERGVRVRVLVDDAPVGGTTIRQAAALDRLEAAGVDVAVVGGERARYDYHHPKYAVVDDRALVLTENWKPSGTGGRSNRGWGVRVASTATADELAAVFRTDATGPDTTPWSQFRRGRSFTASRSANGTYRAQFDSRSVAVDRVRLVTAPGNAERAIVGVVDSATERVSVVQPTVGGRHHPFLRATLRAAERGVDVRILLSGTWYVAEENRRLVDWLNERAERRNLPLEARVAAPDGRFEKIHAKAVVADDRVVVGSVNWNPYPRLMFQTPIVGHKMVDLDVANYESDVQRELNLVMDSLDDPNKGDIVDYIDALDATPATTRDYIGRLRRLSANAEKPLRKLDRREFKNVLREMGRDYDSENGYADGTRRKYIEAFVYFSRHHNLDVADNLTVPSVNQSKIDEDVVLSFSEVSTLIETASKPRQKAIIATYWEAAPRVTALASLRVGDYEPIEDTHAILTTPTGATGLKGADGRKKPLTVARGYVDKWLSEHPCADDDDAALFCRQDSEKHYGEHMTPESFRVKIKRIAREAGIDPERVNNHAFRHARATWMRKKDEYGPGDIEHNLDWTEGTNQHERYEHINQSDQIKSLLRAADIDADVDIDVEEEAIKCPRCDTIMAAGTSQCPRCHLRVSDDARPQWLQAFFDVAEEDDDLTHYLRQHEPRNIGELGFQTFKQVSARVAVGLVKKQIEGTDEEAAEARETLNNLFEGEDSVLSAHLSENELEHHFSGFEAPREAVEESIETLVD